MRDAPPCLISNAVPAETPMGAVQVERKCLLRAVQLCHAPTGPATLRVLRSAPAWPKKL